MQPRLQKPAVADHQPQGTMALQHVAVANAPYVNKYPSDWVDERECSVSRIDVGVSVSRLLAISNAPKKYRFLPPHDGVAVWSFLGTSDTYFEMSCPPFVAPTLGKNLDRSHTPKL